MSKKEHSELVGSLAEYQHLRILEVNFYNYSFLRITNGNVYDICGVVDKAKSILGDHGELVRRVNSKTVELSITYQVG